MVDFSPAEIKEKIRSDFHLHATLESENIFVNAIGSLIQLTGRVRSWTERKDAEDVAWSIPGVTEVENKLEVGNEVYDGE